MEYTLGRIEEELQDILYHLEELKNNPESENACYQVSGLIRSAGQLLNISALGMVRQSLTQMM